MCEHYYNNNEIIFIIINHKTANGQDFGQMGAGLGIGKWTH